MKRLIIISIICLLMVGCSANYNVEIDNGLIVELFEMKANKKAVANDETLKSIIDYNYDILLDKKNDLVSIGDNSLIYTKIDNDNYYGLSLKREYEINDYYKSFLLRQCYSDVNIETEDNKMIINTSSMFNCFDTYKWLDEVNINLKTKYYVLSNNADRVDGYTYTWVINRNNYRNKDISVNIDLSSKSQFTLNSEQSNKVFSTALIIIGVVVLVGGCFVGIKVFKSNR